MKNNNNIQNFIKGFGSIVDIFPSSPQYDEVFDKLYQGALTAEDSLRKDWESIRNDMHRAMETLVPHERKSK